MVINHLRPSWDDPPSTSSWIHYAKGETQVPVTTTPKPTSPPAKLIFTGIKDRGSWEILRSWEQGEPKGPDPPNATVKLQEIAGLMIRDYENHWFPLIRPAIRAGYFLGGGGLGGVPLDCHDGMFSGQFHWIFSLFGFLVSYSLSFLHVGMSFCVDFHSRSPHFVTATISRSCLQI